MKISVFGIGYVGVVTAGCLCEQGHQVVCVDVNKDKVADINVGIPTIVETGLTELLQRASRAGKLTATTDQHEAVLNTDVSIVCVGTPSLESGRLNLAYVSQVYQQIATSVAAKPGRHLLIVRSTILPGSVRGLAESIRPELVKTGKLEVCFCPEFLREGSAIADFHSQALSVYGSVSGQKIAAVEELMGECKLLPLEAAELVKYTCNYWHAVKVAFANEVGRLSKHLGIDGQMLMQHFCQDTQLNISPSYMRPGTPFGGSCLPKDVSALNSYARQEGVSLPMLDSVLSSNQSHLDHVLKLIGRTGSRQVLIVGLTFKNGTDDVRGSPMVAVAETLLGKGYGVDIYDSNIELGKLTGTNQIEIERRLPHLARRLTKDFAEAISRNSCIIVSQDLIPWLELRKLFTKEKFIIDINGNPALEDLDAQYIGLCWNTLSR
jgi:GDP-mannose 6-dehydrogenase